MLYNTIQYNAYVCGRVPALAYGVEYLDLHVLVVADKEVKKPRDNALVIKTKLDQCYGCLVACVAERRRHHRVRERLNYRDVLVGLRVSMVWYGMYSKML